MIMDLKSLTVSQLWSNIAFSILQRGVVDKWLKKQGDKFLEHEPICQLTLENNLSIEFDAPTSGFLANILVQPGVQCKVGDQLAMYVTSKEEYWKYLDKLRMTTEEDQKLDQAGHNVEDGDKELTKYLLREIRKLTKSGKLESESGTFPRISLVSLSSLYYFTFLPLPLWLR